MRSHPGSIAVKCTFVVDNMREVRYKYLEYKGRQY